MKLTVKILFMFLFYSINIFSKWNDVPEGWGDIRFGLVNDDADYCNRRLKVAADEGVKIAYRYRYVNSGADKNSNALSWMFTPYKNYATDTPEKIHPSVSPAFVIYMLQEEGGNWALTTNAANSTFMKNYFESIKITAEYANGMGSTFVIEPDTWGYLLQGSEWDTASSVLNSEAHINDLGLSWLTGFNNKVSNIPQAVIHTIKTFAPDAYAGILMSFWSHQSNNYVDPEFKVQDAVGFADWHMEAIEYSANINVYLAKQLLSRDDYSKGDFIGVEKNGYSAGYWKVHTDRGDYYYWDDYQMEKWLRWSDILSKGIDLPLLGWQISIGHMGLPNSSGGIGNSAYEDTFFPYFFNNVQKFVDLNFIGFLVGKGLADCTDYSNLSTEPDQGDGGWFFEQLKEFDKGRPYLGSTSISDKNKIVNKSKSDNLISISNGISITLPISEDVLVKSQILTIDGKSVNLKNVRSYNGKVSLNTKSLSNGFYILKLSTGNFSKSFKICKL